MINLTKTKGAGSLAHEWWHALDYYFNTVRHPATDATDRTGFRPDVREEMRKAFLSLMSTIRESDYYARSVRLEDRMHPERVGTGYYDKATEAAARAFQEWVLRRLTERGQINDFLSSFTPEDLWNGNPEEYPYPRGEEGESIGSAFDALFGGMLEREEGDGNRVLYERVVGPVGGVDAYGRAVVEGAAQVMRDAGIKVHTDVAEIERMYEAAKRAEALLDEMRKRKSAPETVVPGGKPPFKATVVSEADGAKILQNLETFAKESENLSIRQKNDFISSLANVLQAHHEGSNSQYADFETLNGRVVTIRLADHNATVSKFDYAGREDGISIVISRKPDKGITDDGDAHLVEFYYSDKKLKHADDGAYAAIVRSIQQALYSGEYKDTTGLATPHEVNGARFLRTERGEVLGFTLNGEIYLDPRVAKPETPVHEYTHLWADALEVSNPKAWSQLREKLLGDEALRPLVDEVKLLYPELADDEDE